MQSSASRMRSLRGGERGEELCVCIWSSLRFATGC